LRQQAAEAGITLEFQPYAASADALRAQLAALRDDAAVDAVLTLYPMPRGLPAMEAAMMLGARKDVDGLHPVNAGLLLLGAVTRPPATARACMLAIGELLESLRGAEIVIVGASRIVGRPLASLLLDAGATVTLCHAATGDLASHTQGADVVVTAAGVPGLIEDTHIREGAILIDVSVVRTGQGLVGDVDRARVRGKAAVVTHVPDGVGPITTACLLENVVAAAEAARNAG
jgi:methylenetetrahydrofolate dehydrogenase (NADP+)/methenyltetrahydrofolate cyclohydrolase